MRLRRCGLTLALVALATVGTGTGSARAQYGYPYGYGGYGWGGWNSPGNVYGSYAAGLGWMAAGQGQYNLDTAEARSINVNTNMNLNEYMYQSLLQRDRMKLENKAKQEAANKQAYKDIQDRIRNHPTDADLNNGDALNLALTELSDPRYAYQVGAEAAQIPVPGALVRQIPFNKAADAITVCLADQHDGSNVPEILKTSAFDADREQARKLVAEIKQQIEADQAPKPETVSALRKVLKSSYAKLNAMKSLDANVRMDGERALKAMMGLTNMLDGPSLDVFLAGVENKQINLGQLLGFMKSFNLRFGVAKEPNQRAAYASLYPVLIGLRGKVFGEGQGTLPSDFDPATAKKNPKAAREFFAGIHPEHLDADAMRAKGGLPKPPAPMP